MDAVSIFDHVIVSIREGRFSRPEVSEILQEFWQAYPEVFETMGLDGTLQPDYKDYDENLPDRDTTGQRPY
jgi:hypothetical protein